MCRIGPDGGRPLADRGIGGTGAPPAVADRGIGGTGAPPAVADRGIGGTGVIGVITGFASVCVAGEEVALPPDTPARIDGAAAGLDELRAGQLVALEAAGRAGNLRARQVTVLHVVAGPVATVGRDQITVAGQDVLLAGSAGIKAPEPGDWVAVSGLRQADGTIAATRVDAAPRGPVLVRGELVRTYGSARIGSLAVRMPDNANTPSGFPVVARGRLQDNVLVADSVVRDLAAGSPSAYFGPQIDQFIVEANIIVVPGGYTVGREFVAGGDFAAGQAGRGIATYSRDARGRLASSQLTFGSLPSIPAGSGSLGGASGGSRTGPGGGQGGAPRAMPNFGPVGTGPASPGGLGPAPGGRR